MRVCACAMVYGVCNPVCIPVPDAHGKTMTKMDGITAQTYPCFSASARLESFDSSDKTRLKAKLPLMRFRFFKLSADDTPCRIPVAVEVEGRVLVAAAGVESITGHDLW